MLDSHATFLRADLPDPKLGLDEETYIGGSTADHGATWNWATWLPSLIISSARTLNCLPDSYGPRFSEVDWVPSDLLSFVVTDIALANSATTHETGAKVFNSARLEESERGNRNETVNAPSRHEFMVNNPAVKLFDFYRYSLAQREPEIAAPQSSMIISRAVVISAILRDMSDINPG
ncbi:hypothetical protein F5Y19DRAFT_484290 [Xylariaceae sp. FL1651]|nr:hypothetical protein F5Y19DRAFT_484290 [Xylariaceae sp. FL1651]